MGFWMMCLGRRGGVGRGWRRGSVIIFDEHWGHTAGGWGLYFVLHVVFARLKPGEGYILSLVATELLL